MASNKGDAASGAERQQKYASNNQQMAKLAQNLLYN